MIVAFFWILLLYSSQAYLVPSITRYGNIALSAKKKGAGKSEVRVRLLQDISGLGQKGTIHMVSSAMWMNVMSAKKTAEKISDDQFEAITTKAAAEAEVQLSSARS
jgi:hypothetical protein